MKSSIFIIFAVILVASTTAKYENTKKLVQSCFPYSCQVSCVQRYKSNHITSRCEHGQCICEHRETTVITQDDEEEIEINDDEMFVSSEEMPNCDGNNCRSYCINNRNGRTLLTSTCRHGHCECYYR
jgi:hypothetical protein